MEDDLAANALVRQKIMGYIVSRAVCAVTELGVPDRLADGPRGLVELADAVGAQADALGRFLRVLVAEGLFTEPAPDVYGLTHAGELLRSDVPGSLRHFVDLMAGEAYAAWGDATYSVRTGKPAFDHVFGQPYFSWLDDRPDAADRFNRAQAGLVELRLLPLLDWEWQEVSSVVDVGGGNGVLLAGLLDRHAHLRGAVFDLPQVIEAAGADLGRFGSRAEQVAGDFFASVPAGAEVYVLSQILHDWDDEDAAKILQRCREAMPPAGRLLLLEQVLADTPDSSPTAMLDLHMLVLLGGRERTRSQWTALLAASGFALDAIRSGPRSTLIEARPC